MSSSSSISLRSNTTVNHLGVRRLSLVADSGAAGGPADMAVVVADAISALKGDGVERLKSYLLGTGADPAWVGRISKLTHLSGGDLSLELADFQYTMGSSVFQPTVVSQSVFDNPTSAEITQQFSFSKTTTDTFAFKFTEGLKVGTSTKVKAGLPAIVGGEVSVSAELTFGAEQQWTTTESRTWSASVSVKVPAQNRIRVTASLSMARFTADFVARARVVGCPGYLVGTGNEKDDSCVDAVVPLSAFFPKTDDMPWHDVRGTLTGSEGVNVLVLTENF